MEYFDKTISNEDMMKKYPAGTYYKNAHDVYHNGEKATQVKQVTNPSEFLGLQSCGQRYYAESGGGCLFFGGIWAPVCDAEGNLLPGNDLSVDINYEIF